MNFESDFNKMLVSEPILVNEGDIFTPLPLKVATFNSIEVLLESLKKSESEIDFKDTRDL